MFSFLAGQNQCDKNDATPLHPLFFQVSPYPLVRTHLRHFQAKIIKFVWGKGGYWLSISVLFRLRGEGGLGLPNLLWYYQAAQLAHILIVYSRWEFPDWIHIERQVFPFTPWTISYDVKRNSDPQYFPNRSHTCFSLWDNLRHHSQLTSKLESLMHLFQNPVFPPRMEIKAFSWWLNKGLFRIGHFF